MNQHSERQEQIIQAAIELIAQHSIQDLTIKNLSAKIGVTEAALYRHFSSKLEILLAILEFFKDNSAKMLEQVEHLQLGPLDKILFIFQNRFKTFQEKPSLAAAIFSEEIFQNDQRLSEVVYEIMNFSLNTIVLLIDQGQRNGSIRADLNKEDVAMIMVGGMRLLVTRWRLSKFDFDLQDRGEAYIQALRNLVELKP